MKDPGDVRRGLPLLRDFVSVVVPARSIDNHWPLDELVVLSIFTYGFLFISQLYSFHYTTSLRSLPLIIKEEYS